MIIKSLILCSFLIGIIKSEENVIVKTLLGSIEGITSTSSKGNKIFSFLGVPYAEPPVGNRRFKEPQPKIPWSDKLLKATQDGRVCPQPEKFFNNSEMSEDCLFMNIHTQNINGSKPLAPVLFFIHGGGYYFGAGHSKTIAGPDYLLNHNVVLVSINYRLGPLGFASTGDQLAPGNMGFKDMIMALNWVKENIEFFGGDPNLVTIFGHSAGGMSVTHLLVSPMSKGLFHRAIAMSGSATSYFTTENQLWTNILAKDSGCVTENSENMLECLRGLSWEQIIKTFWSWENYPFGTLKWNYEIERDFGQKSLIIEDINAYYKRGDWHKVPLMAGIVPNEFDYVGLQFLQKPDIIQKINQHPEKYFPVIFDYPPRNFKNSKEITDEIRKIYMKNQDISNETSREFGLIFSDAIISYSVNRLVNLARKYDDIYVYHFGYKGIFSEASSALGYEADLGVSHGDELQYLFSTKKINYTPLDKEHKIVDMMTSIFVNFAYNGNPNFEQHPLWTPSNKSDLVVFHLGDDLKIKDELIPRERYEVWEKLLNEKGF